MSNMFVKISYDPFKILKYLFFTMILIGMPLQIQSQCALSLQYIVVSQPQCGNADGQVELYAVGGQNAIQYLWSSGQTASSVSGLSAGLFQITISDGSTCPPVVEQVFLENGNFSIPSFTLAAENCNQNNGQINLLSVDSLLVSWSGAQTGSSSQIISGNYVIPNLTAGNYILSYSNAQGCILFDTINLPQLGQLSQTTSILSSPSCGGINDGSIRVQVNTGSLPFTYYLNGALIGTFSTNVRFFSNLVAGVYQIRSVDANGCEITDLVILDEVAANPLNINDFTVTQVSCPGASNGIIQSSLCPSCMLYDLATGNPIGNFSQPLTGLNEGNYEIRLNSGSCISYLPLTLSQPDYWSFSFQSNNSNCVSGSIQTQLQGATAPYNYLWSNGETSSALQSLAAGFYQLTVTDLNGCVLTPDSISIDFCSSLDTILFQIPVLSALNICIDTNALPFNFSQLNQGNCSPILYGQLSQAVQNCITYNAAVIPGNDTLCVSVCDQNGFCDSSIVIIQVFPKSDEVRISVAATTTIVDTCSYAIELQGPINTVTNLGCALTNNGSLSILPNNCVQYQSPAPQPNSGIRTDSFCIQFCDNFGYCDTVIYIFDVIAPNCLNYYNSDVQNIQVDLSSSPSVCLSQIPNDSASAGHFQFIVNGINYNGNFGNCNEQSRIQYPALLLPTCSNFIVSWTVNNLLQGPDTLNNLQDLIIWMNAVDTYSNWSLNSNNSIINGTNANGITNYGNLTVNCLASQGNANIGPTIQSSYAQGSEIYLPQLGLNQIIINSPFNCVDTFNVQLYHPQQEIFYDTILLGSSSIYCLPQNEVPNISTIINDCTGNGPVSFGIQSSNACISYQSDSIGTGIACIIYCSNEGICDTSYLYITTSLPVPTAIDDQYTLSFQLRSIVMNLCNNDIFAAEQYRTDIIQNPTLGILSGNSCQYLYVANADQCGIDSFTYVLSNMAGADTATVYIQIECTPFTVYDGFSPNGDGINDFLVVKSIDNYTDNQVFVFNRWGNQVFKAINYQNDWDGKFNQADLPDADYLLLVLDKEGNVLTKNWIRLQR